MQCAEPTDRRVDALGKVFERKVFAMKRGVNTEDREYGQQVEDSP